MLLAPIRGWPAIDVYPTDGPSHLNCVWFLQKPQNARQNKTENFETARSPGFGMTYDTRSYICRRRSVDGWLVPRQGNRSGGLPPPASVSTAMTATGAVSAAVARTHGARTYVHTNVRRRLAGSARRATARSVGPILASVRCGGDPRGSLVLAMFSRCCLVHRGLAAAGPAGPPARRRAPVCPSALA